ncbi:hypothetical protein FPOAC2_13381 [Fusarium poae]|uniref:uncharacterized protein n=1 Tax=Fusarium poae TaxID=36050 RepID=UPI001D0360F4|nr:uncharacterized protein FPOAC1_013766 [Fusarium poae]KAG8664428.1 hypothetical protein FPOAC1_013766 [Fusarium poae]
MSADWENIWHGGKRLMGAKRRPRHRRVIGTRIKESWIYRHGANLEHHGDLSCEEELFDSSIRLIGDVSYREAPAPSAPNHGGRGERSQLSDSVYVGGDVWLLVVPSFVAAGQPWLAACFTF